MQTKQTTVFQFKILGNKIIKNAIFKYMKWDLFPLMVTCISTIVDLKLSSFTLKNETGNCKPFFCYSDVNLGWLSYGLAIFNYFVT
jgi:hypothetical protein